MSFNFISYSLILLWWGFLGSLRKQGLGVPLAQQNQEFRIQNEDFPALPGYKGAGLLLSKVPPMLFAKISIKRISRWSKYLGSS